MTSLVVPAIAFNVKLVPLPINNWPFVGIEVRPVPPYAIDKGKNDKSLVVIARKIGTADGPDVGPAQNALANCEFFVKVKVPSVVTGDPETVIQPAQITRRL